MGRSHPDLVLYSEQSLSPRVSGERLSSLAVVMVLGAVVMWSSGFPLIKVGLQFVPPLTFAFIRYSIAAMMMAVILVRRKGMGGMVEEFRSDWRVFVLVGIFGTAIPNALLFIGLQYTSASLSASSRPPDRCGRWSSPSYCSGSTWGWTRWWGA